MHAFYFSTSEQLPTACGLGERFIDGALVGSAGYLIQALPNPSNALLTRIEKQVLKLPKLNDSRAHIERSFTAG